MSVTSSGDDGRESAGEGYVEAVDGRGQADAGEDTSGSEYVGPEGRGEPDAPGAGEGYVDAVDGRGQADAGEDTSGSGYVSEE